MKILLIEDDEFKKKNILKNIGGIPSVNIKTVGSVNSAVTELRSNIYDLVISDMSLPTFDYGPHEKGGRPQGFGGREILRQLDRFNINVPVIVVTQYATFDGPDEYMHLEDLEKQLLRDHSSIFNGLVFYDAASDNWKKGLTIHINRILMENTD